MAKWIKSGNWLPTIKKKKHIDTVFSMKKKMKHPATGVMPKLFKPRPGRPAPTVTDIGALGASQRRPKLPFASMTKAQEHIQTVQPTTQTQVGVSVGLSSRATGIFGKLKIWGQNIWYKIKNFFQQIINTIIINLSKIPGLNKLSPKAFNAIAMLIIFVPIALIMTLIFAPKYIPLKL